MLKHTVRTHLGASDDAHNCVFQREDDSPQHYTGVQLSKELMAVAGQALKVGAGWGACTSARSSWL